MTTIELNPVEIAAYISSGALAATKLLTVCKPLWNRLPPWLAVTLPIFTLDLPMIAQYFNGTTTLNGLFTAFVTSLALVLPGLKQAKTPCRPLATSACA